ncbi:MAG: hypothetical protein ABI995_06195 [Acidobacteriota bacterium]
MPEQMNMQNMLYVFEAVVLGVIIIFGYLFRKRAKERSIPLRFAFDNSAPFELAYAVGTEIPSFPSTEIVSGLFMYFNEADNAKIFYGQLENEDSRFEAGRYCLRVTQREVTGVEWLSLERRLAANAEDRVKNVHLLVIGRSNLPTEIAVVMIMVREDGQSERSELGTHTLSSSFQEIRLEVKVGHSQTDLPSNPKVFRFIILLEVKAGLCVDLETWDVDFEQAPEGLESRIE